MKIVCSNNILCNIYKLNDCLLNLCVVKSDQIIHVQESKLTFKQKYMQICKKT